MADATIARAWDAYRKEGLRSDICPSDAQKGEVRRAYYAGTQLILTHIAVMAARDSSASELERCFSSLEHELEEFNRLVAEDEA